MVGFREGSLRLVGRAVAAALVAMAFAALLSAAAGADTLHKLTVSRSHPHASWKGSASFDGLPNCATGSSCDTVPIDVEGAGKRYLRRHHAVLLVTIRWQTRSDTYNLELDNAKDGSYVRSSAAATDALPGNPLVQRVGVNLPPNARFSRELQAVVSPGQSHGGYTGHVSLVDEPASHYFRSAGFRRQSLSLSAKGPLLGAGEPSLSIGPTGTINVTAPASSPAVAGSNLDDGGLDKGVIYFRSVDGGHHWTSQNIGSELGGGDSDVVSDSANGIYVEDLALAPSTIFNFKSTDNGDTFAMQTPYTVDADREWMATYLPKRSEGTGSATVYTVYHGLANQEPLLCISNNGGLTTACQPGITDPQIQVDAAGNTDQGNVVVEKDGDADFLFVTSTLAENLNPNNPSPGTGPLHNLYLGHYDRSSGNITDYPVYLGHTGHWITGLFPVLAIDRQGNLFASWPESPTDAVGHPSGPWSLKIAHSTDGGKHWSKPDVMNPPQFHNNLLNWITAGSNGSVNVIWAASTAESNEYDATAKWFMFFAQSRNALVAHPHFTYRQITPHPIRYGNVCVLGLFCPSDDSRSLLDFAQVELDKQCRANVVYGDNSKYVSGLLRKNQIFRGDGTGTDFAQQGSRGFRVCPGGSGGAGGSGSYDFGGG